MKNKRLRKGLKPSGRIMLFVIFSIFTLLFLAVAISFASMAHTGFKNNHNLLSIALDNQIFAGHVSARRGTIKDSLGNVIASQHPSHTMFANFNPAWSGGVVADIEYTARMLETVMDVSYEQLYFHLSNGCPTCEIPIWQVEFGDSGRRLTSQQKNRIQELNLPGINFHPDLTRFYPMGAFAAHTIGYTTISDIGVIGGAMGIESYFNDLLTGTNGRFQFLRDGRGMMQPGAQRHYITEPLDGHDITLTINNNIQIFLETAMDKVLEDVEVESITAVVIEANTGKILASGSRPTFNPNQRNPISYANPLTYPIEPGSTMKIFTYAAAIDAGVYEGNRTFIAGSRSGFGWEFRDHPNITRIPRTFDEGFLVSTNTSIVDILQEKITHQKFLDYLSAFGFGKQTGFPTFEEHSGYITSGAIPANVLATGFGQHSTVTPLQMIQAVTAIVNEGYMLRPQIISRILDPNNDLITEQFQKEVVGQPISSTTAQQMKNLMIDVVANPIGTAHRTYFLDVPSGGKTGTAEIAGTEGRLLVGEYIFSYVGFAPAENPELIMYISVRMKTENNPPGHTVSGTIYQFVMNNSLRYLGLTQNHLLDGENVVQAFERTEVPRLFNMNVQQAREIAEDAGFVPIIIGNGKDVFNQSPSAGALTIVGEKIFIQTDVEDQIPNMTGWTRTQIAFYEALMDIDITIIGQGTVVSQSIRQGRLIKAGDMLEVILE